MNNQSALDTFLTMYHQGKISNEEMQIIVDQLMPDNMRVTCRNVKNREREFVSQQSAKGYKPVQLDALGLVSPMDILFLFLGIAGVEVIGPIAKAQQKKLFENPMVRKHVESMENLKKKWEHIWHQKKANKEAEKLEEKLEKQKKDKKDESGQRKPKKETTAKKVWEKGKWILPPAAAAGVSLTLNEAAPAIVEAIESIGTAIQNVYDNLKAVIDGNWKTYSELVLQEIRGILEELVKFANMFKEWIPYVADFIKLMKNSGPAMEDVRNLILEPYSQACKDVYSFRDVLREMAVSDRQTTDAPLPKINFPNLDPKRQAQWAMLFNLPIIGPMMLQPQLRTLIEMQKQARANRGYSSDLEAMAASVGGPNPLAFTKAGLESIASNMPVWFMK